MCGVTLTNLHNWVALRAKTAKNAVRNSLILAQMPTSSSTAQILGNNESRRVPGGQSALAA